MTEEKKEEVEVSSKMTDKMQQLEQIHEQLRELREKRKDNSKKLSKLQEPVLLIRAKTSNAITLETDSNGKRVYSNNTLRNAELRIRLSENEEYKKLVDEVQILHDIDRDLAFEWNVLIDKKHLLLGTEEEKEYFPSYQTR